MKNIAHREAARMTMDFHIPIIKMPQSDGSLVVRPGTPEVSEREVTIAEFSRKTGISVRHLSRLCELGQVKHRHLTNKKRSKIMIPRSELARYRKIEGDV